MQFLRGELKDKRDSMEELITPNRCISSENTNDHRVALKNPSDNTEVKDTQQMTQRMTVAIQRLINAL